MDERREQIETKDKRRFQMLLQIYDLVGTDRSQIVNFFQLGQQKGLDRAETLDAYLYLSERHLIKRLGNEGEVTITVDGIDEIEDSYRTPERHSNHFIPSAIQLFTGPVGTVQTAPHSVSTVTQHVVSEDEELLRLLSELRSQVETSSPEDRRGEACELIDGLEQETRSPRRSKGRIKALATSLARIVEGTTSTVLSEIISRLLR